jgi:transcriptional regulator with XRE-family HTH domain
MEQWEGVSKAAIGRRLALTREVLDLQQNEFCEKAKIAPNAYNQYERGKKRPSIENAIRLCQTYALTLDWIYLGNDDALRYSLASAIKALKEKKVGEPPPAEPKLRKKLQTH